MKVVVYKYRIPESSLGRRWTLHMPPGRILLAAARPEGSVLWAEVDADEPLIDRTFFVVGTGQVIDGADEAHYLTTWFDGPYVWHLYEDVS